MFFYYPSLFMSLMFFFFFLFLPANPILYTYCTSQDSSPPSWGPKQHVQCVIWASGMFFHYPFLFMFLMFFFSFYQPPPSCAPTWTSQDSSPLSRGPKNVFNASFGPQVCFFLSVFLSVSVAGHAMQSSGPHSASINLKLYVASIIFLSPSV